MAALSTLGLPERRRNYRFALTPLADAMFQLLIFFMLSSGLTPYSLLTLQSAQGEQTSDPTAGGATNDPTELQPVGPQQDVVLWTVESEAIIVGGQSFGFDALDDLATALGVSGASASVVLIVRPTAQVQDITTVLARLSAADITSVQISTGASK